MRTMTAKDLGDKIARKEEKVNHYCKFLSIHFYLLLLFTNCMGILIAERNAANINFALVLCLILCYSLFICC